MKNPFDLIWLMVTLKIYLEEQLIVKYYIKYVFNIAGCPKYI